LFSLWSIKARNSACNRPDDYRVLLCKTRALHLIKIPRQDEQKQCVDDYFHLLDFTITVPSVIAYIDESKARNYIFVLHMVEAKNQRALRKLFTGELLAGQRSFHFRKENNRRRVRLIRLFHGAPCRVYVFKRKGKTQTSARNCLISKICDLAARLEISELVFEFDKMSFEQHTKLLNQIRARIPWDHRERHQEPLLWVADAVAWCVNRGGEWERMVRPMIVETIEC
jgi:hypothetical protein